VLIPSDEGAVQARRKLAFAGAVFAALVLDGAGEVMGVPQVRLHGLPEESGNGEFFEDIALDAIDNALDRLPAKRRKDDDAVTEAVRRSVRGAIRREWGKKAQVTIILTRISRRCHALICIAEKAEPAGKEAS
jgi:ribonuclease J